MAGSRKESLRTVPTTLTVPPGEGRRNLLVAVGQEQATKEALAWALEYFVQPGDALHLMECVPPVSQDEVLSLALDDVDELGVPSALADPGALWEEHHSEPNWHLIMDEKYGPTLKAAKVPYYLHMVQDSSATTKEGIAGMLSKAAERLDSAAVILASRSRGGLGELLRGSVANSLAHKCTKPVAILHLGSDGETSKWDATQLAVHKAEQAAAAAAVLGVNAEGSVAEEAIRAAGRNILVADDGTDLTLESCKWTLKNLVRPGDTIQLVHVIPCLPPMASVPPFEYAVPLGWPNISEKEAEAEEKKWMESQGDRFRDIMETCKINAMNLTTVVDYTQDPATTIGEDLCQTAATLDAKALVIAGRRHNAVDELLFGSVANHVAHFCTYPVVLLHF